MLRFNRPGLLVFTAIVLTSLGAGCSAKRRAAKIEDSPREFKVTLGNGIQKGDRERADLLYEIGGCISGWITGKVEGGKTVTFASKEFKPDIVCSMRIRNFALADDPRFKWASNAEKGVLYHSSHVVVQQAIDGALVATVAFQQLYSLVPENPERAYKLEVSVKFPEDIATGDPITATLDCKPAINANGTFKESSKAAGSFNFDEALPSNTDTEFSCDKLTVFVAGQGRYSGSLGGKRFKPQAKQVVQLADEPVILTENVDPSTGEVLVSTEKPTPYEECKADEVFNTVSGKCVKKP